MNYTQLLRCTNQNAKFRIRNRAYTPCICMIFHATRELTFNSVQYIAVIVKPLHAMHDVSRFLHSTLFSNSSIDVILSR